MTEKGKKHLTDEELNYNEKRLWDSLVRAEAIIGKPLRLKLRFLPITCPYLNLCPDEDREGDSLVNIGIDGIATYGSNQIKIHEKRGFWITLDYESRLDLLFRLIKRIWLREQEDTCVKDWL